MRHIIAGLAAAVLTVALASPQDAVARQATVVAAGDIACDTEGAAGTLACQQRATSDLVAALDPDAVLTLGDHQYPCGRLGDFTASYGPTWGRFLDRTHPAIGNDEYEPCPDGSQVPGAAGYWQYFGDAATPLQPGCRSACAGWYGFDLGAWHVVVLNSNCEEAGCEAGGAQERWLRRDLAAHRRPCTLAAMHHPRFSSAGNARRLEPLWRALRAFRADVVLGGHAHAYERFAPMGASGRARPVHGLRQFVVGTGGASLYGFTGVAPGSQVRDAGTFGVLELRLQRRRYAWRFVPAAGGDGFTDAGATRCG